MVNNLETVYSPALLDLYDLKGKTVVIIDILRATSTMCVAFQYGARRILPVSTPEEAAMFKDFDFLTAAERNAQKLEGFDLGNSPFEFQSPFISGRNIAFTTTNGTKALKMAKAAGAANILVGSFLNIDALCQKMISLNQPAILFCAGWKDKFNLEDTLFAGAVASKIQQHFDIQCDSTRVAIQLYENNKSNLTALVKLSNHAQRFQILHVETDDVTFCMQENVVDFVPELRGEYLEIAEQAESSAL